MCVYVRPCAQVQRAMTYTTDMRYGPGTRRTKQRSKEGSDTWMAPQLKTKEGPLSSAHLTLNEKQKPPGDWRGAWDRWVCSSQQVEEIRAEWSVLSQVLSTLPSTRDRWSDPPSPLSLVCYPSFAPPLGMLHRPTLSRLHQHRWHTHTTS